MHRWGNNVEEGTVTEKGKIRKPQFIWKDRLLREKVHYGESRFERNLKKG